MKQYRTGVFETNSSSVHTLTICTEREYDEYVDGKVCRPKYGYRTEGTEWEGKKFIPIDAARELERKHLLEVGCTVDEIDDYEIEEELRGDFDVYEEEDEYLVNYCERFVTPSGDRMVVFGKYGWDG